MAWMQQASQELANMLPGPRFQPEQPAQPRARMPSVSPTTTATEEDQLIAQQRESRRERRRMKQASPGEGRNVRQSGTGGESDGGLVSPTRSQTQAPPQLSPPGPEPEADMARYGLAADVPEPLSPSVPSQRRRMSPAGRLSPEPRTPSEYGSEGGSPSRRMSRTDMLSSRDSLESLPGGGARAGRRGSGFKKSKGPKQPQPAVKVTVADLHVVGEIVGASGFDQPMLFCRWELLYDSTKSWTVVRGLQKGATHACVSDVGEVDLVVWEHPLDIHMTTQSLQGWPALLLMVYARDESVNRNCFVSYALVNIPNTPGLHHVSCQTWFAVEANRAMGRSFFAWHTGLIPRLDDEDFITNLRKREDAGPFVCTVGAGKVHLRLSILTRHLDQVTHHGGESLAAALERLNTDIRRSAAMEERRRSHDSLSEGLKHVRSGREERFTAARSALDARRRGDSPSPVPSEAGRNPSFLDRQGRSSSFRGFTSVRGSGSPKRMGSDTPTGADDNRSETSFAGRRGRRDRFEEFKRRDAERRAAAAAAAAAATAAAAAPQEGEGAAPSTAGSGDGGGAAAAAPSSDGAGAGLSRAASVSDAAPPRSNSGGQERGGSRSGAAGPGPGPTRPVQEDDGLDTIDGSEQAQAGPVVPSDVTAARAAERLARRARQRAAF